MRLLLLLASPETLDSIKADSLCVFYLRNWGTFSHGDYLARAVHLPGHPEHGDFLKVMRGLTGPKIVLPSTPFL